MKIVNKIMYVMPVVVLLVAATASAHVTVKPDSVGIGKFQTFNISVPTEQDQPTVGIRLVVPPGLGHVSPTVKPGWTIRLVEEDEVVKEIIWSGGSIPAHFRDDFGFSAQAPTEASTIYWKAYQTYRDGSVVAWELLPNQEQPKKADGTNDFSESGPASQTKIINDLTAQTPTPTTNNQATRKNNDALTVSMIAVVISVLALYFAKRK